MFSSIERKLVLGALLVLVPTTLGLLIVTSSLISDEAKLGADVNGYVEPKELGGVIALTQDSTVTVRCAENSSSGFAVGLDDDDKENGFSLRKEKELGSQTLILTTLHSIEACLAAGLVKIDISENRSFSATILDFDNENDLAFLATKAKIEPLVLGYQIPFPGFWVMAIGSPHNFSGSITFGNIINYDELSVYSTASLSPGNSGGPLVDNVGLVVGINQGYKPIGQNFNISISNNALCKYLLVCSKRLFIEEEQ